MKFAVTAGAIVGGTVAFISNKEKVLEFAEHAFQAGANFCRDKQEQLKQANMAFADSHLDGSFNGRGTSSGFSSGVSTPELSDEEEEEDDEEGDDGYFDKDDLD